MPETFNDNTKSVPYDRSGRVTRAVRLELYHVAARAGNAYVKASHKIQIWLFHS